MFQITPTYVSHHHQGVLHRESDWGAQLQGWGRRVGNFAQGKSRENSWTGEALLSTKWQDGTMHVREPAGFVINLDFKAESINWYAIITSLQSWINKVICNYNE